MIGGETLTISTSKGDIAFEMHRYCGPMPINRRTGSGRNLPPQHPFWRAVTEWIENGMIVERGPARIMCVRRAVNDDVAEGR